MKISAITAVSVCLLLCCLTISAAFGGTCNLMSLTYAGGNDYVIRTNGSISNVQSIILKVGYGDENKLASKQPVVQEGTAQWTFFNATSRTDGLLIYASAQQPFLLSGAVARIRFARITTPPTLACTITADYVKNENNSPPPGAPSDQDKQYEKDRLPEKDGSPEKGEAAPPSGPATMSVHRNATEDRETSDVPAEEQPPSETREEEAGPLEHEEPPAPPEPEATPQRSPDKQPEHIVYRSIRSRFQELTGERTPATLTALFSEPVAQGITQAPPIGFSDGESVVTLTLKGAGDDTATPLFILKGARLLTLTREPDGLWAVKALPDRGVSEAILTVVSGEDSVVYPLTVVPRIIIRPAGTGPASEADFTAFLAQRDGEQGQAGDLNGDGRRDYLDDYIFTANYLAATSTPPSGSRTKEPSPSPAQP